VCFRKSYSSKDFCTSYVLNAPIILPKGLKDKTLYPTTQQKTSPIFPPIAYTQRVQWTCTPESLALFLKPSAAAPYSYSLSRNCVTLRSSIYESRLQWLEGDIEVPQPVPGDPPPPRWFSVRHRHLLVVANALGGSHRGERNADSQTQSHAAKENAFIFMGELLGNYF